MPGILPLSTFFVLLHSHPYDSVNERYQMIERSFILITVLAFFCMMLFESGEFRVSLITTGTDNRKTIMSANKQVGNESFASKDKDTYSILHDLSAVLEARYFLIDIKVPNYLEGISTSYAGVRAYFCPLDWTEQREAPNTVPRYSNILQQKSCSENKVSFDFADIVRLARTYDQTKHSNVHRLTQSGFIYHESRCGSTLVANMLTAANASAHRVYSEPNVLMKALKSENTELVKDVLYMMGRSSDSKERRVFYKLRSIVVRRIQYMPPEVPWIFLYRDPEEVLASHFNPTEWKSNNVVCLQERSNPSSLTYQVAKEQGKRLSKMSDAEFCAARLASLCLAAIQEHTTTKHGHFFNYNTLPHSVWETILPKHFGVQVNSRMVKQMKEISGVYSKGRANDTREWHDDEKQSGLSDEQRKAAHKILEPYYIKMEEISRKTSKMR